MWTDYVSDSAFIKELYTKVPDLNNVEISRFNIDYYGMCLRLCVNLLVPIDNIPLKWKPRNYNAVTVEFDFWNVQPFNIRTDNKKHSSIMFEGNNNEIIIEISGGINTKIVAECVSIQKVYGYRVAEST